MAKLKNDFDLDLTVSKDNTKSADVQFKSISLCTPGCPTGILMGCHKCPSGSDTVYTK
ncbi:lantibiotic, gallidermin/nisin family [Pseudobutyrivibrio sp. 49]|uniref:gallidermin/nisin family lantibiotic n=1 Tax=unclassified Pseudobutyrivibrio TaxID=2638619 RepID=UPI000886A045|nr:MULTISPECIES: gallidermin/nisin family lantibiotic [unclassified Pseudobutyrivibrio]SDI40065.1 lantibiotic, gallidermin/nisin family [Pseudobutyrivibrio sp. 49]SFO05990.1 lantibiotic, gallidermin/nisin family [Pseudobutyrivibrio sp. UC1225]